MTPTPKNLPTLTIEEQLALESAKDCYLSIKANAENTAGDYAEKYVALEEKINTLKTQFEAENAELIDLRESQESQLRTADDLMRTLVINIATAHGVKTIDETFSIKETVTPKISDMNAAIEWARHNAPIVLTIDAKKFKDVTANMELPFVTKTVKTSAVIKGLS